MYPDWQYPTHVGGYGNPLAPTYLNPTVSHLEDLCQSVPRLGAWLQTARVTFLDRSISFSVPKSGTVTQTFNLTGGADALVFSRTISVIPAAAPSPVGPPVYNVLPGSLASLVDVQVAKQTGSLIDTEQAPANNNFGLGYDPNKRASPEYWPGSDLREFTLVNNSNVDVTVNITFTLVLL